MDFNEVTISGRLTRQPETKQAGSTTITSFSLAVNQNYKAKSGEWVDKTLFIDCKAWSSYGEYLAQKFEKGDWIVIKGSLELEEWEKDGQKNRKHVLNVQRAVTKPEKKNTDNSIGDDIPF